MSSLSRLFSGSTRRLSATTFGAQSFHAAPAVAPVAPLPPAPEYPTVKARDLRAGDVVVGSGFVIEENRFRAGSGSVTVLGHHPGRAAELVTWSAVAPVRVRRYASAPVPRDIPAHALHGPAVPDGSVRIEGVGHALSLGFPLADAAELAGSDPKRAA